MPKEDNKIESVVEAWWTKHFHNSSIAGDTTLYNVLYSAKEELKTTLKTLNNKEI